MKVKEIMSNNIKSLSPNDYVSKLMPLIEKHRLRHILIVDKDRLKGIVHSKDVAEIGMKDPTKTKINSLLENTPALSPEQDIEEAAKLMFNSGIRLLPIVEDEKTVGILSMQTLIKAVLGDESLKKTRAKEIMSAPEVIKEYEDIGRARILMRKKGISRLPVVDNNGKLVGIVTIFDLLKSVKPMNRIDFYSMASEKEKTTGIKISSIMTKSPLVSSRETTLDKIGKDMISNNVSGIVIGNGDDVEGIVTMKDLLEAYVYNLKKKGVIYQISGLGNTEDDFVIATVERMIGETLQKMSKIFDLEFFFLHVKKYNKEGKIKYSIRARLKTAKKIFMSKSYAWDLRDAVNETLSKLEIVIKKEKETYRSSKQQTRKLKKFSG